MAKVAFISSLYYPHIVGGAEATVQTLAEEITGRGIEAVVITLAQGDEPAVDEVKGVKVYRIRAANLYQPFGAGAKQAPIRRLLWHVRDTWNSEMAAQVARILELERPDWVSTQGLGGFGVAVWNAVKAQGIGLSHTLHDYYLMCPRTTMYGSDAPCTRRCASCFVLSEPKRLVSRLRGPDLVISISRFVLERHLRAGYFPEARTTVIHNASKQNAEVAPARVPAPGAALVIGYIGRVDQSKGIEVLLQALTELPAGTWQLRVAGRAEPDYLSMLQQRYPLPGVSYLGFVKREDFYSSVDVVVVPSVMEEPFGMTAVEPLGFGVPVIVARSGGLPEIVEDTDSGWLFPSRDHGALAARLKKLLAGDWDRAATRASALERVKHFAPARQADEFLAAIGLSA